MSERVLQLAAGLFVLAGLVALLVLAVQVSGVGDERADTYSVFARFDNIGGLAEKSPVRLGGVRIGRVGKITLDPGTYTAMVVLEIQRTYADLPGDTSAAILTSGLLGSQFIGLTPGADDFPLEEGDEIVITQSALQLENLISRFLFEQGRNIPEEQ